MDDETLELQTAFMNISDECVGLNLHLKFPPQTPFDHNELQDGLARINKNIKNLPTNYVFKDPQNQKDFADFKKDIGKIYKLVYAHTNRGLLNIADDLNDHISKAFVDVYFGFTTKEKA